MYRRIFKNNTEKELAAGFLPDVFVEPEDGGDMFLRNVH
jgi:hypothetical protein